MSRVHLVLLAVVVVWAGSFSAIKQLLDDGVAAGDIAILRYAIAAPGFAYILWRARGLPGLTRGDAARVVAAGLFVVVGYHVFLNLGERHTTSGLAALVVALSPGITRDRSHIRHR
jgi:drug/metabolite transporter (DMT)-like permease